MHKIRHKYVGKSLLYGINTHKDYANLFNKKLKLMLVVSNNIVIVLIFKWLNMQLKNVAPINAQIKHKDQKPLRQNFRWLAEKIGLSIIIQSETKWTNEKILLWMLILNFDNSMFSENYFDYNSYLKTEISNLFIRKKKNTNRIPSNKVVNIKVLVNIWINKLWLRNEESMLSEKI